MTFDTVVGQRGLVTTLKNAIQEHKLAHAYLFCGPRGVGKTTCARIFAKTINCEHLTPEGEACDQCESCRAFNEGRSYSIHELDAASNNSVENIRSLIEQVRIPPQVGQYKVFIIDEVHMLSTQAFNAFLKTLEEPPVYAKFILATTERHKVLPTILSRCQVYDFYRISMADIIGHLRNVAEREHVDVEDEALSVIAQKADGGMRDALSLFDQMVSYCQGHVTYKGVIDSLNILDYDYYFRFTDLFLEHNVPQCMLLFNEVLQHGFDGGNFIGGLASHFRDLLVSSDAVTLPLLDVSDNMRTRYQQQAARCTARYLYRAIRLCTQCDLNYKTSRNKRLSVELTLIQLAQCPPEGDDGDCAGRPPRRLNPLFGTVTVPSGRPNNSTSAAPVAPAVSSQPAAQSVAQQPIASQPVTPQPVAQQSVAQPIAQPVAPQPAAPLRRRPRTVSIHSGLATSAAVPAMEPVTGDTTTLAPAPQAATNRQHLAPEDVVVAWNTFAASLPHEDIATAERMRTLHPTLNADGTTFTVSVPNKLVEQDLQQLRQRIEAYMRNTLRNDALTMVLTVQDAPETVRFLTPREQYAELLKQHDMLKQFTQAFDLDLN